MGYSGIDIGETSYGERLFLTARRQLASFRLVAGAIALEREKLARGHYPVDASALLPRDPFAPQQPLRYRLDGATYRLWSIGMNAVDDGGSSEPADILL
jgi:hypothetical protein